MCLSRLVGIGLLVLLTVLPCQGSSGCCDGLDDDFGGAWPRRIRRPRINFEGHFKVGDCRWNLSITR